MKNINNIIYIIEDTYKKLNNNDLDYDYAYKIYHDNFMSILALFNIDSLFDRILTDQFIKMLIDIHCEILNANMDKKLK